MDIHASTASLMFDVPVNEVTPDMRRIAKILNLGISYGLGGDMEHTHLLNNHGGILTHDHEADPTHYPPPPSLGQQALAAQRRYLQLLREMTPEQFVEYHGASHAERDERSPDPDFVPASDLVQEGEPIHTPFFCKEHCSHG